LPSLPLPPSGAQDAGLRAAVPPLPVWARTARRGRSWRPGCPGRGSVGDGFHTRVWDAWSGEP